MHDEDALDRGGPRRPVAPEVGDAHTTEPISTAGDVHLTRFGALVLRIGEVRAVRQGRLALGWAHLPGRYVPPWYRE